MEEDSLPPPHPLIPQSQTPGEKSILFAWIVMLLCSLLPNIFWIEVLHQNDAWLFWGKIGMLSVLLALSFVHPVLRPLRAFFLILAGIFTFEQFTSWIGELPYWKNLFSPQGHESFVLQMFGSQLLRVATAILIITLLWVAGFQSKQFFLTPGQLRAPIRPVRWLGFPTSVPWTQFGGQYAIYISLGTLAFLILAGHPSLFLVLQALPLLPIILVLAAMNAFSEEMTYRASMIAALEPAAGPVRSMWVAALFFGIGHFYGVPYGIIGVLLASFLGWFLGKAMIETRGMFWPWLIHFFQDVAIFSFMAIGSITPGG